MATIYSIDLVASDPNIRSGRPVIVGTGICVSDIAAVKIFHQKDPDEIAAWFNISLPEVYAALSYYYSHKDEIDAEIQEIDCTAQEFKEKRIGSRHPPLFG